MLTWEDDAEVHALHKRGWTISAIARRKRAFGDGVCWFWGQDDTRPGITVIAAYRNGATAPARVLELDDIRIVDGAVAGEQLWLIGSSDARVGEGRQVLICTVDSEVVHRVGSADAVDISGHCWPVGPEPLDHRSYVRYCLRRLEGLQFSDVVSNVRARYVGQWPDGRIHLSFTHARYPDLTLVTRLNLYDEQGERLEDIMKYVPVRLMEQADTGAYPPASCAVDGVLYVRPCRASSARPGGWGAVFDLPCQGELGFYRTRGWARSVSAGRTVTCSGRCSHAVLGTVHSPTPT
jgi:hypothetical protein